MLMQGKERVFREGQCVLQRTMTSEEFSVARATLSLRAVARLEEDLSAGKVDFRAISLYSPMEEGPSKCSRIR